MLSTRRRNDAVIAVQCVAVHNVAAFVMYLVLTNKPIHTDAATIPSAAADLDVTPPAGAVDRASGLARAWLVQRDLPGLSVAVSKHGAIVWAAGFGYSDVDRTPMTPLTRFKLGALSKPITAAAIARLYDRGRIDLDAPIQKYVRGYPPKQWPVTLRQVMADVAGVHRIRGDNNDAMPTEHCESVDAAVALLANEPLMFEPGTRYRYSIWGWVLVSGAVEGASGEPFAQAIADEVLQPLAMDRTAVSETDELRRAMPAHDPRDIWGMRAGVQDAYRTDYSCLAGAGAFLSTPTDLARFGAAMIAPGFLKADTITTFETPARLASDATSTYAPGWAVGTASLGGQQTRMVSHRGSPMGGGVALLTFPDLGLSVAVAAAWGDVDRVNRYALEVAEAFARRVDAGPLPAPKHF
jgi:CubicO group peptidase (beta-lactamase class C family)